MSGRELASARSYWKRAAVRAGRRSRYVEVREASLETVRADAVECGLVDQVVAVLGTGKEADVYIGLWKEVPLALKVYRIHRTSNKKNSMIGYGPDRMTLIAAREFTILNKAYRTGVPVPTPARRVDNMFTMRFLGDGQRAPSLREVSLENPRETAQQTLEVVEKMLRSCIVHGDLSEYNILVAEGKLFVIDFPQAVDFSSKIERHRLVKEAERLLQRDLENLQSFFSRLGVDLDASYEFQRLRRDYPELLPWTKKDPTAIPETRHELSE
jgi:RIO kinase 1